MTTATMQQQFQIPETMQAWVLGNPDELRLVEKPVPQPGAAEVLVRIGASAARAGAPPAARRR